MPMDCGPASTSRGRANPNCPRHSPRRVRDSTRDSLRSPASSAMALPTWRQETAQRASTASRSPFAASARSTIRWTWQSLPVSRMNERVDPLALQDAAARGQALDVSRSWLVRAPAGSGKTELLIQRFLALLAHVEKPEAIVATTFTRKAAAEMRDRVVAALLDAQATLAPSPASEHHVLTRRLARAALLRDAKMGWRLLEQPARLRIVTIDALAAALARQAPLAAGLGA